jgi:hypothetical protein
MYLPLAGSVALPQNGLWKHGADKAAADRSQGSHSGLFFQENYPPCLLSNVLYTLLYTVICSLQKNIFYTVP